MQLPSLQSSGANPTTKRATSPPSPQPSIQALFIFKHSWFLQIYCLQKTNVDINNFSICIWVWHCICIVKNGCELKIRKYWGRVRLIGILLIISEIKETTWVNFGEVFKKKWEFPEIYCMCSLLCAGRNKLLIKSEVKKTTWVKFWEFCRNVISLKLLVKQLLCVPA